MYPEALWVFSSLLCAPREYTVALCTIIYVFPLGNSCLMSHRLNFACVDFLFFITISYRETICSERNIYAVFLFGKWLQCLLWLFLETCLTYFINVKFKLFSFLNVKNNLENNAKCTCHRRSKWCLRNHKKALKCYFITRKTEMQVIPSCVKIKYKLNSASADLLLYTFICSIIYALLVIVIYGRSI